MRRAAVLGLVVAAIAWFAVARSDGAWAVEVRGDNLGLSFEDPCKSMVDTEDTFATGGGGGYYILLKATSREEADAIASCYRTHGLTAETRRPNADDRTMFDGRIPECDEPNHSRPCSGSP